jgi:hypothetical protein
LSPAGKGDLFILPSNNMDGYGPGAITMDNIDFIAGPGCDRFGRIGTSSTPKSPRQPSSGNTLRDIRLSGGSPSAKAIWQDIKSKELRATDNNRLMNIQRAGRLLQLDWDAAPPLIGNDGEEMEVLGPELRDATAGWNAAPAFKRRGRRLWVTELRRLVFAAGEQPLDDWLDSAGAVAIRPGYPLVGADRPWRRSPRAGNEFVLPLEPHDGRASLLLFADDLELEPGLPGFLEPGQFALEAGSAGYTLHVRLPGDRDPTACGGQCLRYHKEEPV